MNGTIIRFVRMAALLLAAVVVGVLGDEASTTTRVEVEVNLAPGNVNKFVIEVHPEWAPLGAARFLELVDEGDKFWKGLRFFRVIGRFFGRLVFASLLSNISVILALPLIFSYYFGHLR